MARKILTKQDAKAAFAITIADLAAAAGRQSTLIANSDNRPSATIYVTIKTNAYAPTAGKTYAVYLLRKNGTFSSDSCGDTDAAITIVNAVLLGTLTVTASANTTFKAAFHTKFAGPLGPNWGVALVNNTDQKPSATPSDSAIEYAYDYPEVQ